MGHPHDPDKIAGLFSALMQAEQILLSLDGIRNLSNPGVYVLYEPDGTVLHVGRTKSESRSLFARLNNHRGKGSSSSVVNNYYKGARLPDGCTFMALAVKCGRCRALLEAFAIGRLCPLSISGSDSYHIDGCS